MMTLHLLVIDLEVDSVGSVLITTIEKNQKNNCLLMSGLCFTVDFTNIAKMHIYCCKFQNIVPGIEGFAKRKADTLKNILL